MKFLIDEGVTFVFRSKYELEASGDQVTREERMNILGQSCPALIGRIARSAAISLTALICASSAMGQENALVVVLPDEPQSLDPCETDLSNNSRVLRNNITETLVNLDPASGAVVASLAEDWALQEDGAWRFKLRHGVSFHDGTPFNAEAAAKAIDRVHDEALACRVKMAALPDNTYTPTVVDEYTLDVRSENFDPILPVRMSTIDIGALSTSFAEKSRAPVGTGPYKFVRWSAGQDVKLEANDGYWGDRPAIDDVTFIWRTESTIRAAMVDTGEAQLAFEIAPQDASTPLDKTYLNGETNFLRMDTTLVPLNDVRVRRAANLAIDRQAFIGTVFHKDVAPATQPIIASVLGYNADIKPWPYDPAEARRLLDEAKADGVPVDTEIVLYGRVNLYPNSSESLEILQAMLLEVGLNVRLEVLETDPWLKHLLRQYWLDDRQVNMVQSQVDNTKGDAVFSVPRSFITEGSQSTTSDPKIDDLLNRASVAVGDERRGLYQEALRYGMEEIIPQIPLFHMVSSVRVAANVNYEPDLQAGNVIKLNTISYKP